MALLEENPALNLYDPEWVIHTRSEERPPVKCIPPGELVKSMASNGCVISGTVVNSVLSPGVQVEVGAVVRDSIVMFDSVIGSRAVVDRAILDKEVTVGAGAIVGEGPDDTPNQAEPGRLNTGITVVGKQATIPRGARVGRNVRIGEGVRIADFVKKVIRGGGSVDPRPSRRGGSGQEVQEEAARSAG